MAYNKVTTNNTKEIKYLAKDYQSFKNQLLEFTKFYFPDNFNDFSEGNPGMMFLEMAAHVGDVLSYYLDTQIQENFLTLAQEEETLYEMAYLYGYTPKTTSTANVNLDISQLVPSTTAGSTYVPDYSYALNIRANSTFRSIQGDQTFYTTKDANFNYSSSLNPISASVYTVDGSNNPEYYLLTSKVPAVSGKTKTQTFTIGALQRFLTLDVFDADIVSIESVVDSDGNEYHQVPYLAQDTVFEEITNTAANDPVLHQFSNETPYLLKLKKATKRFVVRFKPKGRVQLQFGGGDNSNQDEQIIPNADNIGLGISDGRSKLDRAYDPSNFLFTKAYGQSPSNTTLTVTYLVGGGSAANVSSNTITKLGTLRKTFNPNTNANMRSFVESSIAVANKEGAKGGGTGDTLEDIRLNSIANFAAQNRTVTKEDYIIRALSMPAKFGSITKAYITQDDQITPTSDNNMRIPNPLALNLYTLGYNLDGRLATVNTATKRNLVNYLGEHRMLTDAINIKNAFIVNFGIDFTITAFKQYNNQQVLLRCVADLKNYFDITKWQINQPIVISEVFNLIGAVQGVQTVEDVTFKNLRNTSLGYSQFRYSLTDATRNGVIYPSLDPCIFEIRYPNSDIQGQITTY